MAQNNTEYFLIPYFENRDGIKQVYDNIAFVSKHRRNITKSQLTFYKNPILLACVTFYHRNRVSFCREGATNSTSHPNAILSFYERNLKLSFELSLSVSVPCQNGKSQYIFIYPLLQNDLVGSPSFEKFPKSLPQRVAGSPNQNYSRNSGSRSQKSKNQRNLETLQNKKSPNQ